MPRWYRWFWGPLAALLLLVLPQTAAAAAPVWSPPRARVQVLTGAALTAGGAYVPIDVELALRLSGPVSLLLGSAGYLAPFANEGGNGGPRPNALAALGGLRLDLSLSARLQGFAALRGGIIGQDGIALEENRTALALGLFLSPRAGINVRLGQDVACVLALGYDLLPRGSAGGVQMGLAWRAW